MGGWVKLYRSIVDNWVWQDKPFSKGQAWIDLIIMANHKENKFPLGNEVITVERGSLITSELKLMERWGWSKSKVRQFLNQLQNDSMIVKKTDRKKTTINIINYDVYQDFETTEEPKKDQSQTNDRPKKDTNKNDKNVKNDKKYINIYPIAPIESATTNDKNVTRSKIKFAEFVSMTNDEYEKLLATYGKEITAKMIEILDNYKGATGRKYKSDYRAILSWVVEKVRKELPKGKEAPIGKFTNETDKQKIEKYSKLYLS